MANSLISAYTQAKAWLDIYKKSPNLGYKTTLKVRLNKLNEAIEEHLECVTSITNPIERTIMQDEFAVDYQACCKLANELTDYLRQLDDLRDPEEELPEWAARLARPNCIEPMQQLFTLDGARTGNATVVRIIRVDLDQNDEPDPLFEIVTDANSWSRLSVGEIHELFSLGKYILNEFPNPKSYDKDPE